MLRTGVQTCRVIVNKKIDCRVVAVDGCLIIILLISFIFSLKPLKYLNYRMRLFLDAFALLRKETISFVISVFL
jgi:multisubunit Na+/H+ antiporter MnhF subunit